jgi:choline transport protein
LTINSVAAASRQAWSFARDGYVFDRKSSRAVTDKLCSGLPFSNWFTRLAVVDSVPLPLNAILASMLFVIVLALLVLGGDQIFNSIVGLLNGAVSLTYVLSISCVLWRRCFGEPLPPARWSLGKLGIPLNIIAIVYQSFTTIISFFPLIAEVTAANFNWYISTLLRVLEALLITFLQGNRYVCVGGYHRFLELLHFGQEDLRGTCCQHHQRCIEVRCAWKGMCIP